MLYMPPIRSKNYQLLAIATFISLMLLATMVMLSYQPTPGHEKYRTSVNLTEAIGKRWISTAGNIKSVELVGDELLVTGDGRLTIEANRFNFELGKRYKITA